MAVNKQALSLLMAIMACLVFSCSRDDEDVDLMALPLERCDSMPLLAWNGQNFVQIELDHAPIYIEGGNDGFIEDFNTGIVYPAYARENGFEGTVLLQFEVSAQGTIESIEIIQDPGGGLGDTAKGKLEDLAARGMVFYPARVNDQPIRVRTCLNAFFRLQS